MIAPTLTEAELFMLSEQVDLAVRAVETPRFPKKETVAMGRSHFLPATRRSPVRIQARAKKALDSLGAAPPEPDESFETYKEIFLKQARRDLCLPGGYLFSHWKRFKALEGKDVVKVSHGWLVLMGVSEHALYPIVVSASVFLLTTLTNIGINALCEGCKESRKS